METLTKILEKISQNLARIGWVYGAPVYPRPPWHPHPRWYPPPAEGRPLRGIAAPVNRLVD